MILSRGRFYLFLHIPKTGGTALSLALEARAMRDDLLIGDTPKARARRGRLAKVATDGRLWKHSALADLDGLLQPGEAERLFIFTLVRNPWDRLVSYYHWLRLQRFDNPAVKLAKALSFHDFLWHDHTGDSLRTWPFSRYVSDSAGVERCNLWIRLEQIEQDIAPLERHLGFTLLPLPRVNESGHGQDYRACYSDNDAARVAELCRGDIARFGYSFR